MLELCKWLVIVLPAVHVSRAAAVLPLRSPAADAFFNCCLPAAMRSRSTEETPQRIKKEGKKLQLLLNKKKLLLLRRKKLQLLLKKELLLLKKKKKLPLLQRKKKKLLLWGKKQLLLPCCN